MAVMPLLTFPRALSEPHTYRFWGREFVIDPSRRADFDERVAKASLIRSRAVATVLVLYGSVLLVGLAGAYGIWQTGDIDSARRAIQFTGLGMTLTTFMGMILWARIWFGEDSLFRGITEDGIAARSQPPLGTGSNHCMRIR